MDDVVFFIFYCLLAFGFITNVLVIYVIFRYSIMKCVSNIYTVHLMLCNLFIIFWILFHVGEHHFDGWIFGVYWCKAIIYLAHLSYTTTSFFITVITVERYLAICRPYALNYLQTYTVAYLVSCTVWLIVMLIRIPVLLSTKVKDADAYHHARCSWENPMEFKTLSFTITIVLNLSLVVLLYFMIMLKLHKTDNEGSTGLPTAVRKKETHLVLAIVLLYLFSWTPFWGFELVKDFAPDLITSREVKQQFKHLGLLVGLVHCGFCPVIYIIYGKNFPQCFRKMFGLSKPLIVPNHESTIGVRDAKHQSTTSHI